MTQSSENIESYLQVMEKLFGYAPRGNEVSQGTIVVTIREDGQEASRSGSRKITLDMNTNSPRGVFDFLSKVKNYGCINQIGSGLTEMSEAMGGNRYFLNIITNAIPYEDLGKPEKNYPSLLYAKFRDFAGKKTV